MKALWAIVKWLWWLGVAYIPYGLHALERRFMHRIGCPPRGDCYVPGSDILLDWDVMVLGSAAFLWPVCFLFLAVSPLLTLWRKLRPKPTKEFPRLCRGGSRSLTYAGVHRGNSNS